jgi:hypothetical protein
MLLEPAAQGAVDQVTALEQVGVDFLGELDGIAPIAQHRRSVHEHGRLCCRAGEAGQPCDPLGRTWQILAAVLVGAHQHEAIDTALAKDVAQPAEASGVIGGARGGAAQRGPPLPEASHKVVGQVGSDQLEPSIRIEARRRCVNTGQQGIEGRKVIGQSAVPQKPLQCSIAMHGKLVSLRTGGCAATGVPASANPRARSARV